MSHETDVVILGGGLAGLTLARQLLLETDRRVVLLERRPSVPAARQKVGESTVQLAGYYLSKVLDLEEHLLRRHFLKYNLRFYWPSHGRSNRGVEDCSQSYIRDVSNVASYQIDRNVLEAELVRLNSQSPRFSFTGGVSKLEVDLRDEGPHRLRFRAPDGARELAAAWVIDATGRGRFLARRQGLERDNPIRHGSFFWWVDGLVDVEKLTARSRREVRLDRRRSALGHLPAWLATNHLVGEGFWFWIIPLHGKTSLGLVYDRDVVAQEEVFSVDKATRWICDRFPFLARDLPRREVLDRGGFKSYSYDCAQTIHPSRWAMTGEAGRFSDPLYSPGSDLIAIHNTLIVDAIRAADDAELGRKCAGYEALMRALYEAYEPSYTLSYDALGDQEVFNLKYVWELAVYFSFYVFPFINDLLTERLFQPAFVRAFARLGPINRGMQRLLSDYFQWKKAHGRVGSSAPIDFDFTAIEPLARARSSFFQVGLSAREARRSLADQLENLEQLARLIAAAVGAGVVGERGALTSRRFVEAIDIDRLSFDPEAIRARWRASRGDAEVWPWPFDPSALSRFQELAAQLAPAGAPPPGAVDDAAAALRTSGVACR